eukprot:6216024-Pyramimonas_sp.AAC.1
MPLVSNSQPSGRRPGGGNGGCQQHCSRPILSNCALRIAARCVRAPGGSTWRRRRRAGAGPAPRAAWPR